MKKMMCLTVVLVAVMAISGVAWSYDFADHVKVAPNGKGDALIYPLYIAMGGAETKIWVTNTAVNRSVVAKIVFRSMKNSRELLDFLIYLTPTDVWNGIIRFKDGKVQVYSTDDSTYASPGVWASATNPLQVNVTSSVAATCRAGADRDDIGYIEIFEAAHTVAGAAATAYVWSGSTTAVNLNAARVAKGALAAAYEASKNAVAGAGPLTADGINVLMGHAEIKNAASGQAAIIPATVLRDYDANAFLTVNVETFLGSGLANNTTGEVEAALSKNTLAMPYSSKTGTLHLFTFPTKHTAVNATDCYPIGFDGPFFQTWATPPTVPHPSAYSTDWETWGCVQYAGMNYDLSENSSQTNVIVSPMPDPNRMCNEVNWISGFAFDEGWALYSFNNLNSTDSHYITSFETRANVNAALPDGAFSGAPVIGTVLNLGGYPGLSAMPAAYSDARVAYLGADGVVDMDANSAWTPVNDVIYYYYQYSDEANRGSFRMDTAGYDEDPTGAQTGNRPGWNAPAPTPSAGSDGFHPVN